MATSQADAAPEPKRAPYEPPRLVTLGSVADLTQIVSPSQVDTTQS